MSLLDLLPFARFPLTVNFLTKEYHKYLENCPKPPPHVKVQTASSSEFTQLRAFVVCVAH